MRRYGKILHFQKFFITDAADAGLWHQYVAHGEYHGKHIEQNYVVYEAVVVAYLAHAAPQHVKAHENHRSDEHAPSAPSVVERHKVGDARQVAAEVHRHEAAAS